MFGLSIIKRVWPLSCLRLTSYPNLYAHGVEGDKSADYYDTNNQTNYLTSHFNYSFRLMATEPALLARR